MKGNNVSEANPVLDPDDQDLRNQKVAFNTLVNQIKEIVDSAGMSVFVQVVFNDMSKQKSVIDTDGVLDATDLLEVAWIPPHA